MRKFLITSTKFSGNAELLYDDRGLLCRIDLTQARMNADLVKRFKAAMPTTIDALHRGEGFSQDTTVIEENYEITFLMFWNKYAKKINLIRCKPLWQKLSKPDQVHAFINIDKYDAFLKRTNWRQKADPETYLKNKYWQNEY